MMYSSSDTTITADMDQLAISSRRTGINNPQTFSSSVHDPLLADLVHSATPGHHSRNPQLQHPGTGLASSSTDENSFGLGITNAPPGTSTPRDAWEGQGEFPLRLEKVSHSAVPVLGGVQLIFTGANFRDGVQAVFECPQLGSAVRPKIITPTVLRDTRMVANAPNLLDWWALLHKEPSHNRGSLTLSVTLTCAGVRNNEDQGTVFTLVATEESETELLHVIITLHRKLILSILDCYNPETEKVTRQRTRSLLDLEQPSMVTRSEHLGLGVIYMLCDEYNHITGDTIDTLLCPSKQGRDVLHFATVLGLSTLVREIARHALERFRSRPVTEESSVFAKDSLGNTALDFARILGYEEIQHVLQETLDAAEEFKASALEAPLRPLPDPPVPDRPYRPGSIGNKSSTYILAENGVSTPAHALNRPLPPTPMTSSPQPDMLSTAETSAKPSSLHHSATSTPYLPPQGLPTTYAAVPQSEPAPYLYTPPNSNLLPGNTPYTSSAPCVTPATVSPATFSTSIYPGPITSMPGHQPLYAPPQSFQFPTPASYTSAPAPHPYLPSASYPYPQQHYPFPQQQAPPSPTSMPIPMAQPPPVSMPTPHLPPPAPLTASPVPNFTNPYALLENQQTSPYRTNSSPYLQSGITPQGQSSPQSAYQSVIAPFRPLPLTPGGSVPSLPLPPPKHKVTQVNRPKQFTIPSATSPQQSDQLGLNPAHSPALQPYNPFVQYQDPQIKVPIP